MLEVKRTDQSTPTKLHSDNTNSTVTDLCCPPPSTILKRKNGECFIETTRQLNLVPRCHFHGQGIYMGSMDATGSANQPKMMQLVTVNGTVKRSGAGPSICLVDFGINENAYFFRVVLPGMRRNEIAGNLSCDIERDGTVHIKGVATIDSGILKDSPRVFHTSVQQHAPRGHSPFLLNCPGDS
ncbi:hypothetical protein Peur_051548 [Populus x canadensis]